MKRFLRLLLCVVFLILAISGTAVSAQDDNITVIPLQSGAYVMAVSPDTRLIATSELGAMRDNEVLPEYLPIHIFDSQIAEELFLLEGFTDYATSMVFNEDGSVLATYHPNGWIYLWNMTTGEMIRQIPALTEAGIMSFLPQSDLMLQAMTHSVYPGLLFWNTTSGAIESILAERFNSRADRRAFSEATSYFPEKILNMQMLPDGETLVAYTNLNAIFLWNISTGEQQTLVPGNEDRIPGPEPYSISLSYDGNTLIYSDSRAREMYSLDISTARQRTIYQGEVFTSATASDADVIAWIGGDYGAPSLLISSLGDLSTVTEIPLSINDNQLPHIVQIAISSDGTRFVIGGFVDDDDDGNSIVVIDNS